jgi:hypothetical protein
MESSMRVTLPLAAAAIFVVGAACSPPEVEGRNPEDAKKLEAPTATEPKPEEGASTPTEGEAKPVEGTPKDETTGIAPITPPPAAGGKTSTDEAKVGG